MFVDCFRPMWRLRLGARPNGTTLADEVSE
jgi:hypothetical protein